MIPLPTKEFWAPVTYKPQAPMLSQSARRRCTRAFGNLRGSLVRQASEIVCATVGYDKAPGFADDSYAAGIVLVIGLIFTGPVPLYISRLSGMNRKRVAKMCLRARRAGIFAGGGVYADPWAKEGLGGILDFVLDSLIVADRISYEGPRGPDRLYKGKRS